MSPKVRSWGHPTGMGTPSPAAPVSCTPNLLPALLEELCSPNPSFLGHWDPSPPPASASPSPVPPQTANYYGSLLQASTVCLGTGPSGDVYVPFRDLLPMVHPNDIVFDGRWGTGGTPKRCETPLSSWVTPCPPQAGTSPR